MSQETSRHPAEAQEEELTTEESIHFRAHSIRISAKDILLDTDAAPESFPNRDRVLQLANEILALVPVYDAAREAADDRKRART
jgi:hypothetical protein